MSLMRQTPHFDIDGAAHLARDLYGLDAAAAALPSERDQNFLITTGAGERYVLKVANASETRAMLEAQNAAMEHVALRLRSGQALRLRSGQARRVLLCPRVLPTIAGDMISTAADGAHLVRLVTYVAGLPLAEGGPRTPALLESLGRAVGRLDAALADFDHPAIHREFHWDLARASSVIGEYLPFIRDEGLRELIEGGQTPVLDLDTSRLRCSAVHHDANDWNVLVDDGQVVGIIDFGDMVHSWTVADPAVAVAYAMLDAPDPLATAAAIVRGYHAAHPLEDDELAAVFPLANLRLCMSVCIAAWQQRQRPDDEYLAVSQEPIRRTLPALAKIPRRVAEQTLRSACGLAPRV